MRTHPDQVRPGGTSAAALGTMLVLTGGQLAASAQTAPFDRGIDRACDQRAQEAEQFSDVAAGDTHAGAIGCLRAYAVVQGRLVGGMAVYDPGADVTRQQMASFVADSLDQLPDRRYALPAVDDDPPFDDATTISAAHERNVDRLHAAGIITGYDDGTFRPNATITRAQMATFITAAIEAVAGGELPRAAVFDDVSGAHQANIEKLTSIGIVQGRGATSYEPSTATTRAQMASFVAGMLDHLMEQGYLVPISYAPRSEGARRGVTSVETGIHDDADRVTFTLDAGEGTAGWNVRYVDEAIAPGSGQSVDVEGDATLQITLTGMALPPELDENIWDDGEIAVGGEGIVEVVDESVYEGRQDVFVGTTGLNDFSVERLDDPPRIYLDVDHAS